MVVYQKYIATVYICHGITLSYNPDYMHCVGMYR